MKALNYIFLFTIFLTIPFIGAGQDFNLRRACNNKPDVTIFWSQLNDPCFNNGKVEVFARKDMNQPFVKIDELIDLSGEQYVHKDATITPANWSYFFKIYSSCAIDSIYSDTIEVDEEFVEFIEIDSVSVTSEGHVQIGWESSTTPDIMGYLVFYVDGNNNIRIDTVFGKNNTYYIDSIYGKPGNKGESYKVAGFDSCFNLGPIGSSHTTVRAQYSVVDSCQGKIEVTFSNYMGWEYSTAATTYRVLAAVDNGGFIELWAGTGGSANITLPDPTLTYILKVSAENVAINTSSTSNYMVINGVVSSPSDTPYLRYVTVTDQGDIEVAWHMEPHIGIGGFTVLRGLSPLKLDSIAFVGATGSDVYTFLDVNSNPDEQVYYYQVRVGNRCLQPGTGSNISRNILLRQISRNSFTWNSYRSWPTGVESYEVFRSNTLNDPPVFNIMASNNPTDTTLIDVEAIYEVGNNGVCYYIVATEAPGNPIDFSEVSKSNSICVIDSAIVFIPNAFVPKGANQVFAPSGLFIDYEKSKMTIFNRWGERVAEINDLRNGWDGTDRRGEQAATGVYIYQITIIGLNGVVKFFDGTIHKL